MKPNPGMIDEACELFNVDDTFNIAEAERGGQSGDIQITYTWSAAEKEDFEKLILRYAQENIMKVKLFIKQPFAAKWIIEPHASM